MDHGGAETGSRRHLPERRNQPLVGRRDRGTRETKHVGRRAPAPTTLAIPFAAVRRGPATCRDSSARDAVPLRRLSVAIVVHTRAGSRSVSEGIVATACPRRRFEGWQAAGGAQAIDGRDVHAVNGEHDRAQSRRHDRQRRRRHA
jgi:hypothetical protein